MFFAKCPSRSAQVIDVRSGVQSCKGKAGLASSAGQNLQFRLLSGGGLLVAFLRDFHS